MLEGLLWGAVAASSLVIGGFLGLTRDWPARTVGLVLAFGAGALISAVSFDLAQEGAQVGGPAALAVGLAAGALTYFGLDGIVDRPAPKRHRRPQRSAAVTGDAERGDTSGGPAESGGAALALGALLDGIPEQLVLGIGIASGEGVSVSLLLAIFVSNLPEAIGGSRDLLHAGKSRATVRRLWLSVAVVCVVATLCGVALADSTSGDLLAAIDGFAAGSLLVMLIDSMIPEAARQGGRAAGLITVLGFAVAAGLSGIA